MDAMSFQHGSLGQCQKGVVVVQKSEGVCQLQRHYITQPSWGKSTLRSWKGESISLTHSLENTCGS